MPQCPAAILPLEDFLEFRFPSSTAISKRTGTAKKCVHEKKMTRLVRSEKDPLQKLSPVRRSDNFKTSEKVNANNALICFV